MKSKLQSQLTKIVKIVTKQDQEFEGTVQSLEQEAGSTDWIVTINTPGDPLYPCHWYRVSEVAGVYVPPAA